MRGRFVWSFLALLAVGFAKDADYVHYRKPNRVMSACSQIGAKTGTFCENASDRFSCHCKNEHAFATVVGCIDAVYKLDHSMVSVFRAICMNSYRVDIQPEQFDLALSNYRNNARNISEMQSFNWSEPVEFPLVVNHTLATMYVDAYDLFLGDGWEKSLYYGAGLLGYWLVVILAAAVANWSKILFPSHFGRSSKLSVWVDKYITIPAIHRSKATPKSFWKVFSILLPSRLESLILFGFLILTVGFQAAHIKVVNDSEFTSKMTHLCLRMLGIRTSFLASYLIPLLILFAGRSNVLQWLTRWEYSTFITFHKWIARVVLLLIFIHSVCYSLYYAGLGTYHSKLKENYIVWGLVGTTAGGLMFFQSLHYLRKTWYEVFLIVHIALAAVFIAAAWIHVRTLGFVYWYYASAAVWIMDRVIRICMLISFGFPEAQVTLMPDDTLKVVVPRPLHWQPSPGQHAYVHFVRPSCFWQSHPFSIVESVEEKQKIVFYCKVKGGVTHGLYQYLASFPGKSTSIKVGIEGPYGESANVKHCNSAVFVAGGNGIPGIFSEAASLAWRTRQSSKKSIKLVWVVKSYASLFWFYSELMKLKDIPLDATIYVTNPKSYGNLHSFSEISVPDQELSDVKAKSNYDSKNGYTSSEMESSVDIISKIRSDLSHIEFREGRPDFEEMVKSELTSTQSSAAFVICGHSTMVDDLRFSIAKNLDTNKTNRVEFYDKLQVLT